MKFKATWIAIILFTLNSQAQEISDTSFGKGLINFVAKDSTFSIKFAPRFQVRYNSTWNHNGDLYESGEQNFLVRRSRLKFDGFAYSPKLRYKIELGLSNRDMSGGNDFNRNTPRYILDAIIMWEFAKNWELWAGQTKLPGNIERVVSSGDLQLIDRSLLNSRFTLDRDMGIQIRHKTNLGGDFLIREKFSLSQGEGRNVTEGNEGGLQYTGRIELLPFGTFKSKGDYTQSDLKREESPKLMLSMTYNFNHGAVRERGFSGDYMQYEIDDEKLLCEIDQTTVFLDAMYKYNGFSFMGEYAKRTAEDEVAKDDNGDIIFDNDGKPEYIVLTGNGLNLQAGYLFKSNYEIAARFTTLEFETVTAKEPTKQYTLGFNKFVVGHKLKVQSDLSYTSVDGKDDNIAFRLGFDFHF
jgi:hypothetical protein